MTIIATLKKYRLYDLAFCDIAACCAGAEELCGLIGDPWLETRLKFSHAAREELVRALPKARLLHELHLLREEDICSHAAVLEPHQREMLMWLYVIARRHTASPMPCLLGSSAETLERFEMLKNELLHVLVAKEQEIPAKEAFRMIAALALDPAKCPKAAELFSRNESELMPALKTAAALDPGKQQRMRQRLSSTGLAIYATLVFGAASACAMGLSDDGAMSIIKVRLIKHREHAQIAAARLAGHCRCLMQGLPDPKAAHGKQQLKRIEDLIKLFKAYRGMDLKERRAFLKNLTLDEELALTRLNADYDDPGILPGVTEDAPQYPDEEPDLPAGKEEILKKLGGIIRTFKDEGYFSECRALEHSLAAGVLISPEYTDLPQKTARLPEFNKAARLLKKLGITKRSG